jgi:hypothetical protein
MRQMMLADHDLDVYAKIVRAAENFNDATYPGFIVLGEFEQLDVDDQSFHIADVRDDDGFHAYAVDGRAARRDFHALRNLDPLVNALILRSDKIAAAPDVELADHGRVSPLEHFDDLAVGLPASLNAGDLDEDAVAMHRPARGRNRNVDVAFDAFHGAIGDQETIAVAMHVETAGGILARFGGDGVLGAQLDEVAAFGEARECGFEVGARSALGS